MDRGPRQHPFHERPSLRFVAAESVLREEPGRKVGVAAVPRSLRIREDQRDVLSSQIAPVANLLGIALAHQKRHGAEVGRGAVRKPPIPVLGHQSGRHQGVDVGHLVEAHHVDRAAGDDPLGLLGGGPERQRHLDFEPAGLLAVHGEPAIDLRIELATHVVAGGGERGVLSPRDRGAPQGDHRHQRVKWHGRSTLEADWELGTDGPSRCGMIPRRLCMHKIKVPRVLDGVAWFMPFAVSPTTGPIAPAALEPPLKPSKPGSMHACTTGTGSPRPGPASGR